MCIYSYDTHRMEYDGENIYYYECYDDDDESVPFTIIIYNQIGILLKSYAHTHPLPLIPNKQQDHTKIKTCVRTMTLIFIILHLNRILSL